MNCLFLAGIYPTAGGLNAGELPIPGCVSITAGDLNAGELPIPGWIPEL